MLTVPAIDLQALAAHLTHFALCWRLVRPDGVALGFTSHDRDMWMGGLLYRAVTGITASALDSAAVQDGEAGEVRGFLSDTALRAEDLRDGRYVGARAELLLVDWRQAPPVALRLSSGLIETVQEDGARFEARLAPLQRLMEAEVGQKLAPSCDARFGDNRCKAHSALYVRDVHIVEVEDDWTLCVSIPDAKAQYVDGVMRLCDGAGAGLDFHILQSAPADGQRLRLWLDRDMPAYVRAGDRVRLSAGCDRLFATCKNLYNNSHNFRGAPHVPGMDSLLAYPGL